MICINNIEMEYVEFGNGDKTMVMIPGISLSPIIMSSMMIEAAYSLYTNDYTVYVFDRKNNLNKGDTIDDIADDYIEVFKALNLKDIYLFGASFGGMISQLIAIKEPEMIRKLALASTVARSQGTSTVPWNKYTSLVNIEELVEEMMMSIYTPELITNNIEPMKQFYSKISQKEFDHFLIQLKSIEGFDVLDDLHKIKCPILVVISRNDHVLPYEEMKKLIDNTTCEAYIFEKASHALYDEEPFFKDMLFSFFKK